MKWNKLTAGACTALMLCTILPMDTMPEAACMIAASAEQNVTEDGFKYEIKNGSATITGYIGEEQVISIPGVINDCPVTKIGDSAFEENKTLLKVVIPKGVKTIGNYSFLSCENLKSVSIPDGVTTIGEFAFQDCHHLNGVVLPDGLLMIGEGAFGWCPGLTEIEIPASVDSISDYLFYYCDSLTSVTLPDTITSIGTWAFLECKSLPEINLPDSVRSIGDSAFMGSGITELKLPSKLKAISLQMCVGCPNLTKVSIPNSVVSINEYAFSGCPKLKSVTIPGSVKSIGENAFGYVGNDRIKFTIYGPKGSAAETYAAENQLAFLEIPADPTTEQPTETTIQTPATTSAPTTLPLGDLNNDTAVDILDVIALNKFLLGTNTLSNAAYKAADVDGKSGVTAEDALLILKFVVGTIDKFPAETTA